MKLTGKQVAILVEDLYQDLEVWYPYYRLKEAGAEVILVGRDKKNYVGKYGYPLTADTLITNVKVDDFDAVLIPGGFAPDLMRKTRDMIEFVLAMHNAGKVVAAICHGVWIPASAGILQGKTATCYYAIADDITNAGAQYVDKEVVVDGNLITARTPEDLPGFCREIIKALA